MRSRLLALALGSLWLCGCGGAVPLRRAAPPGAALSPITGLPLPELISEADELGAAARQHAAISAAAGRGGARLLDADNPELARAQRIFADLVAVAHRSALPWQLHGLESPEPRTFSPGAGYVYFCTGLLGDRGLVADDDDGALAAVLAHEIAHVALQHTRERDAWQLSTLRARTDPYHGPEFSAPQELQADRLAALYLALAGYDPYDAARVWRTAQQRFASNPGLWLQDHPLHPQRVQAMEQAAELARPFYVPDRQQPDWQAIRADNPLFPRPRAVAGAPARAAPPAEPAGAPVSGPPAGQPGRVAQALRTAPGAPPATPGAAAPPARTAPRPTPLLGYLHLLKVQSGGEPGGAKSVQIYLQNTAERELSAVALEVTYFSGERALASDPDCGGPAAIPSGAAAWILCDFKQVPGATEFDVQLRGAEFR